MKKILIQAGVLSVAMLSIAPGAIAADGEAAQGKDSTGVNVAVFRELDMLRSQNAILAEKVKNAELRARIDQAGKGVSLPGGNQGAALPGGNPAAAPAVPGPANFSAKVAAPVLAVDLGSAQVQMVSGAGSNLVALVSLANGRQVNARVGSTIPGVGVVRSISTNEVIVADKKQTIALPFASENPGTPAATSLPVPGQNLAMPPLPPSMLNSGAR